VDRIFDTVLAARVAEPPPDADEHRHEKCPAPESVIAHIPGSPAAPEIAIAVAKLLSPDLAANSFVWQYPGGSSGDSYPQ